MTPLRVTKRDGTLRPFLMDTIHSHTEYACRGIEGVSQSELETDAHIQFYDGIPTSYIHRLLIVTAAGKISVKQPNWTHVAARLLMLTIYKEVTGGEVEYPPLREYLQKGIDENILDPRLLSEFDLEALDNAIDRDSDLGFTYMGLQTLYSRYLIKNSDEKLLELPQHFFMRVAMGIALAEKPEDRTEKAIEFYRLFSRRKYLSSTPTLFNSGTLRPQMSSCFLLSMNDDTSDIYGTAEEAALYSKFSGGIGTDFSEIRCAGSKVGSTGGRAGGVVPYVKLLEVTMQGFDQGGKRKGSASPYLADWHGDVEDFLDILNPAKDHRRTAEDVFPAVWVSDTLMKRAASGEDYSLFSPNEVPRLNYTYGDEFESVYKDAEEAGLARKKIPAISLWKNIIGKRFQHGSYFVGFKDTINHRNPMKDAGMIRSSNLCTEITLRTEPTQLSAVCNLGSVNLANIDSVEELHSVVRTAVRMLDNVIEVGLIPHPRGKQHNTQERPIGLGMMGYAEWLYKQGIKFESQEHLEAANELMKEFSYAAIDASADLAQERGAFPLFNKSEWAKGNLIHDTASEEAKKLVKGDVSYGDREEALREKVKKGMRNSNLLAVAPTATISNITGTTACTELPLLVKYSKTNLNGIFDVVAPTAKYVEDEGEIETLRTIDQTSIVVSTAVRQMWIDQAQSTNLYIPLGREVKGAEISSWHTLAWRLGVKTLYYLRGKSKEEEEGRSKDKAPAKKEEPEPEPELNMCSIDNPDCEACQ